MDTVLVDVSSIQVRGNERRASIRTNLATPRTSTWRGVDYRSVEALARFDCAARSGHLLRVKYWQDPLWTGRVVFEGDVSPSVVVPVRFRGIEPNPAQRIIRAACEYAAVQSTS